MAYTEKRDNLDDLMPISETDSRDLLPIVEVDSRDLLPIMEIDSRDLLPIVETDSAMDDTSGEFPSDGSLHAE